MLTFRDACATSGSCADEKKYGAGAGARSAACASPVDTFFDKVMVMVDDETRSRPTRPDAVAHLLSEFSTIADFSEIVTEGK